jgi:hypothetical protein
MNRQNYLEAIETVLAWDLPEEALSNAIKLNTDFEDDAWDSYSIQSEYMH